MRLTIDMNHAMRKLFASMMTAYFSFAVSTMLVAQNTGVGIDVASPHPSAVLDLDDADNKRGLIVPRLTSTQREGIPSPADGLLVYDSDQKMFYHYDAGIAKWQALNPFSYRRGSNAADEDNFVVTFGDSPAEKSFVIGSVASPTARLEVDGDIKGSENLITTNDVSAATFTTTGNLVAGSGGMFQGYGTIPLGGIIMWSGRTVPDGWALCNGQTTPEGFKTPNLEGRFVVGYDDAVSSNDYTQPGDLSVNGTTTGNVGGAETVTLNVNQIPVHNHVATATTNGSHSHHIGTRGYLTDADGTGKDRADGADGSMDDSGVILRNAGSHNHTITLQNTGGGNAHGNRPPYYVLAFIMRVQ